MLQISAEKRAITGKKVKRLREGGMLPAVVYGKGIEAEPLSVKENEFTKIWRTAGESSLIELRVGDGTRNVLIHDVALHPTKDTPLHVDFYQVKMDELLRVKVPFSFEGESPAVKNLGGILVKVMYEAEVEALPADLPHELTVDISRLEKIGDKFEVKDLRVLPKAKIIAETSEAIALVEAPRSEEEIAGEAPPISLESIEVVGKKKAEEGEESAEGSEAASEGKPSESKQA